MGSKCVSKYFFWFLIILKKGGAAGSRRLIENYHLYSDSKLISFITSNLLNNDLSNYQVCSQKINQSVNKYEDTILHYAVYHKREQLIKFLIKNGADPNKVNKRKQTPMDLAKRYQLTDFLNTCLSEKAGK